MRPRICTMAAAALILSTATASADIAENQVLVVYNQASAEGIALKDHYLAAHPGIPAQNVLALNSTSLLTFQRSQAQFISQIRDPIRAHLVANNLTQQVVAIVLIRPFPHRIFDTDAATAGDNVNVSATELSNGDATYASLDAELVLLWQDLFTGEAGGTMDSLSDNMIDNPYHMSTNGIESWTRANIQTAKTFTNRGNVAWVLGGSGSTRLTPGDMYLVCRIDGSTLADAQAVIDRAQGLVANRAVSWIILDEFDVTVGDERDDDPLFLTNDPFLSGDDYEQTRDRMLADGWNVRYDDTANFIDSSEEVRPLIAYASYGRGHGAAGEQPDADYIDDFNFAPGAMFNTIESFNGRAFNGLGTQFNQEQIADFITAGGTFGVGHVYEPFSFSVFDNEFLMYNMLVKGRTFAEAAYTAMPALSWQHIVVGDPLGRFLDVVDQWGDCNADGTVDDADTQHFVDCITGVPGTVGPACECADFDGDGDIDLRDMNEYQRSFSIP